MEPKKKINYFKRLKMSIFELENYIQFTVEKLGKAMGFLVKTILLLSLIIIISNIAFVFIKFHTPMNYIDSIVPEFSYENKKLSISEKDLNEDQKKLADAMKQLEPTYRELLSDNSYTKADVLEFFSHEGNKIMIFTSIFLFVFEFFDLLVFWLLIALLTSIIGSIVLTFSRIKMKYSRLLSISIYASTLSMILNVVYLLLNEYFGIYIEFFEYLSMLIAYIYVTAVIYMIKSDLIHQQMEIIRITSIKKNKESDKDTEEKKEDKKDSEKKDDSKDNQEDKKQESDGKKEKELSDEVDGSEI